MAELEVIAISAVINDAIRKKFIITRDFRGIDKWVREDGLICTPFLFAKFERIASHANDIPIVVTRGLTLKH